MATSKKRLGRGLDSLLSTAQAAEAGERDRLAAELRQLPLDQIRRGRYQPRTAMDETALQELAESIRSQGVVQPVVVRSMAEGGYELIAGERRWRAAQSAGLESIPAVIRDVTDQAAVAMALIENIQRESLNPLEQGQALHRLIDEFGMTHQQAAEAVGRSRAAVSNLLRLLEATTDVQRLIQEGRLEMGHARALLALEGEAQSRAARRVADQGLSVRATEQLVRRLQEGESARKPRRQAASTDPDIRRLQDDLAERLGAHVRVEHTVGGRGRLVIYYNSVDELDGILNHIK